MSWGAVQHLHTDPLSSEACMPLLEKGRIGRLGFAEDGEPMIERVTYRLVDGDVVIRCGPGPVLDAARRHERASLEVEPTSAGSPESWVVHVQGHLEELTGPEQQRAVGSLWFQPAPDGGDAHHLRLAVREVRGERIVLEPGRVAVLHDD
jgi:nitroimidazol reductase NimA-like FMN-containing flavoprotein (pyridoxamine 5'-phosphate oxidase superfamily)